MGRSANPLHKTGEMPTRQISISRGDEGCLLARTGDPSIRIDLGTRKDLRMVENQCQVSCKLEVHPEPPEVWDAVLQPWK